MKTALATVLLLIFALAQSPVLVASDVTQNRAEADRFYQQSNFKKAYRAYLKLAKKGDHHSQGRVSEMYARGEGRPVDFTEAYAWSVLAAEGGQGMPVMNSEALLEKTGNPVAAQKKAQKLKKKYGKQAIAEQQKRRADRTATRRSGACMGSNLSCSR